MSRVSDVNDLKFPVEVLASPELTLVDFWAEWCAPCRVLGPTIDALSQEYEGRIKVLKMNVDENPDIPTRYGIRGLPTVLFFKDGQVVDQVVGAAPKDAFRGVIERQLANAGERPEQPRS